MINKNIVALMATAALALSGGGVAAQPVKIGVVAEFSGPFADYGTQIVNGMKTYIKQNGDTFGGKKIEVIVKDTTGPRRTSPSASRRSWSRATTSISWPASA